MKWSCLLALLLLVACSGNDKSLKIAATAVPHAEILDCVVKPQLERQGYEVRVIVVDDYNIPNRALAEGEIDANFFQHEAFFRQQVDNFGYRLALLAPVHLEPMGIYSKKWTEVRCKARIAVPLDPTNRERALQLLAQSGFREGTIVELDAVLLPKTLDEVDFAVIPANFALQAGFTPCKDALILEDEHSQYVNWVVIRAGDETRPEIVALQKALTAPGVKEYLCERYQGSIIPALSE